ncbi:MAG: M23 family metallopeptidase [Patescibacteria group bacterium]
MGDEAHAQTDTSTLLGSNNNSQTMALLEANVFSISTSKDQKSKDDEIDESVNVNIVSGNALVPMAGPVDVLRDVGGIDVLDASFDDEASVYVVRKGDSVSAVASMFGVSVDTILAGNDMKKGQKLVEGDVLFILPISGIEHTVVKGQTLQSIAKMYKVDIDDIVFYNDIDKDAKLAIGDRLIIPDGILLDEGSTVSSKSGSQNAGYYATSTLRNATGYFINPVPNFKRKSQGLHGPGRRGIDLAAPTGTPIYASASGIVLLARNGYNGGYGNMVIIQHPNGTKTLYAHMSKSATSTGANVAQGELIGYVGSTGRSTGPHLHFEVFNAKNPGADWSWKQ